MFAPCRRILQGACFVGCALFGVTEPADAQIADLLQAVNQGGGWISLDVVDGRGSYQSSTMPVGGLRFDGCFQVWKGHSGVWKVRAEDKLGDGRELRVELHDTGLVYSMDAIDWIPLFAETQDRFFVQSEDQRFVFVADETGNVIRLEVIVDDQVIPLDRVGE